MVVIWDVAGSRDTSVRIRTHNAEIQYRSEPTSYVRVCRYELSIEINTTSCKILISQNCSSDAKKQTLFIDVPFKFLRNVAQNC